MKIKYLFASIVAASSLLSSLHASAAALRIGVVPGAYADSVQVAAQEAKKQGLDVDVVEFSDWTTPNVALANKDLDANYFQHQPFLDNVLKSQGFRLKSVGVGILANIGLYSTHIKQFSELKDGSKVAIASDPVNQGRGLLLLQKAGLIKLRDGVGVRGTVRDIVANPKHLEILELEGPQLARALGDVDLAQGYPHFIAAAKVLDPGAALLFSGKDDSHYAIRFVARDDNAGDPRLARFIRIYQTSPAVKAQIRKSYANNDKLYSLAWPQ
ncbi:MAG: MetQ/NlpA family ABC transporter substrate-binding protein [Aquitalea sp.]|nr:MetQ/NlpA family ABC transporter substrate-binding protein [Aquitalea sp.]